MVPRRECKEVKESKKLEYLKEYLLAQRWALSCQEVAGTQEVKDVEHLQLPMFRPPELER